MPAADASSTPFTKILEAIYLQAAQEGLERARIERSIPEMQRVNLEASYQEYRRPWRMTDAFIAFDDTINQWKCEFQGVIAWGDTPEMACDNFDHLWIFGNCVE